MGRRSLTWLAALALIGCGGEALEDDGETLYANNWWTYSPGSRIPVCWESTPPEDEGKRAWVRQSIEDTWQRELNVGFTGWGKCNWYLSWGAQIRIRTADERPHTNALGTLMAHQYGGMTLNFTFQQWEPWCASNLEFCIKAIAPHEFGHALGFPHEQLRPDTPASCTAERNGSGGNQTLGPWDQDSIMNYCSTTWNNNGQLSPGDIRGARMIYGRRKQSIVGVRSMCLQSTNQTTMGHCTLEGSQSFTPNGTALRTPNNMLLDTPALYQPTVMSGPTGHPSQHWVFRNADLKGLGGKCLSLRGGLLGAGTRGQLWTCLGQDNQRFDFTEAGEIKSRDGLCLEIAGAATEWAAVGVGGCNGGANQRWTVTSNGEFVSSGKCLTVAADAPWQDADIRVASCDGRQAQQWSISGQLINGNGHCLNAAAAPLEVGPTYTWTCFDAPAERWELFP